MVKIVKRFAAVVCYLVLMSFFFDFRIEKLFDGKQLLIWLLGTGLFLLPSLGEKTPEETRRQKWQRVTSCALWASVFESFLLCIAAMEHMGGTEEVMPEFALCLRPVLYGLCVFSIFAGEKGKEKRETDGETGGFREITASESYSLFQRMGLTGRECEVAILVCQGMSNGEIAESLCISEATVKKHISNIFGKLGCSRREQIRLKLSE